MITEGSEGYEHYPIKIALVGPDHLLDSIIEVEYKLHEAFKRPRRVTSDRAKNFAIEIWAYGGFDMSAVIQFENGKIGKIKHEVELKLPDDDGTNYALDKSKIAESHFEGCDLPE